MKSASNATQALGLSGIGGTLDHALGDETPALNHAGLLPPSGMTFPKLLLPLLAAACLGGCVYEEYETSYQQPSRVYHGGYARREGVVARPVRYYDDRPRVVAYDDEPDYEERPRVYYARRPEPRYYQQPRPYPYVSGAVVHHVHHDKHCETPDERRRREIREAQRRSESRKKDKDHDKKKDNDKKDDDDRKKRKRGD